VSFPDAISCKGRQMLRRPVRAVQNKYTSLLTICVLFDLIMRRTFWLRARGIELPAPSSFFLRNGHTSEVNRSG
jgi:hypothetical protein